MNEKSIRDIIKPETILERRIIVDPKFVEGVLWGKVRSGHPEGLVIHHIGDVLNNIDKYGDKFIREKLRFIAIVHDSFKYLVNIHKPITEENHHAMIARRFSENYTNDSKVLEIIELHDEPYKIWRKGCKEDNMLRSEEKARDLIRRLGSYVDLFLLFYQCDNKVKGKTSAHRLWFSNLVKNY